MDVPELFSAAVAQFDARVVAVPEERWHAPTPCADWDVRELVNHVVVEDLWVPPLLAGSTIAEVADRFDGDQLGEDPGAACSKAARAAVESVVADGAMQRVVHLSFGDIPGSEYALQLFADHLIHAWDLARGAGGDERLDSDLVAACAAWFDANEDAYRSAGLIAAPAAGHDAADPQTRLLARFGREG